MKQSVEAVNKDVKYFRNLTKMFPKLSTGKTKAGIFDETQIRKICNDLNCMTVIEKSFQQLLGNLSN